MAHFCSILYRLSEKYTLAKSPWGGERGVYGSSRSNSRMCSSLSADHWVLQVRIQRIWRHVSRIRGGSQWVYSRDTVTGHQFPSWWERFVLYHRAENQQQRLGFSATFQDVQILNYYVFIIILLWSRNILQQIWSKLIKPLPRYWNSKFRNICHFSDKNMRILLHRSSSM